MNRRTALKAIIALPFVPPLLLDRKLNGGRTPMRAMTTAINVPNRMAEQFVLTQVELVSADARTLIDITAPKGSSLIIETREGFRATWVVVRNYPLPSGRILLQHPEPGTEWRWRIKYDQRAYMEAM